MDSQRRETMSGDATETQPLLRPMSKNSVGTLCIFAVSSLLTFCWCMMDSWNHDVSNQLFGISEGKRIEVLPGMTVDEKERTFNAPLLLAFLQFSFMGIAFSMLFFFLTPTAFEDVMALGRSGVSTRWAVLILTHVFSTFWLQALILPKQPMSLGVFAASRSFEVPVTATIRTKAFGVKVERRDIATPVLMFAACWLLYYAYSQLSQCLCIWSGNGIELTGVSLMLVYILVLTLPGANYVTQESMMFHSDVPPLLLLGAMNLGAALITMPLLFVAHFAGWEDYGTAARMMYSYPQVYMLIVWLCVQMTAAAGLNTSLIYTVNSFWTVSLRSLRVVFWWCRVLFIFYFTSGADLLSTSLPNESYWSFVMFCGLIFMAAAVFADSRTAKSVPEVKDASQKRSTSKPRRHIMTNASPRSPFSPADMSEMSVPPPPPPFSAERV